MNITTADRAPAGSNSPLPARPQPGPAAYGRKVLKALASLQLTVVLFALSLGLVFFGTLAQMNSGIWTVVEQYFWSNWVKVDFNLLVQFAKKFDVLGFLPSDAAVKGWFPFVGGKLLGFALLANLLAAHLVRFKLTWQRGGVIMLHSGMILLFVGEYITREYSVEQRMSITEGETATHAYDMRNAELALVDRSDPTTDRVVVVPNRLLEQGGRIAADDLPVDIRVDKFYKNAVLEPLKPGEQPTATAGTGREKKIRSMDEVSGVDTQQGVDLPAAYVTLYQKGTETAVGTYLVSLYATLTDETQTATIDGRPYDLSLRFTRHYKPYTLTLLKFRFDRYVGTQMAKNYSSQVILNDPERGVNEEVVISMNDPLRYRGETFYQADFDKRTEKTTLLQVVRNPGWQLPYWACALVGVGMLWHFGRGLTKFLDRQSVKSGKGIVVAAPTTGVQKALPWAATGVALLVFIAAAMPRSADGKMDLATAGQLPVVDGGRVKPLDTVARVNMRIMSVREEFTDEGGRTQPAIKWFFDVASSGGTARPDPGAAAKYRIFRIENDQVRKLLGLPAREGMRYAFAELGDKGREFDAAAMKADAKPAKERDIFDTKILDLKHQLNAFFEVLLHKTPLVLPPTEGQPWRGAAAAEAVVSQQVMAAVEKAFPELTDAHKLSNEDMARARTIAVSARTAAEVNDPTYAAWDQLLEAYKNNDAAKFNELVGEYRKNQYPNLSGADALRVRLEAFLNAFAPFYYCIGLYVLAFLLAAGSWVGMATRPQLGESVRRAAMGVLVVTFAVHLSALLARMYLMDRPLVFVTNLYSSAVFIGAASVAICLLIERVFPIGVGAATAAVLGGTTCIIAHNLAASGDTLEMMQAVLDTNFWLATHVTTITLGYSATYVAGVIAIAYILLGIGTPILDQAVPVGPKPVPVGRVIGMIMYAVICGATLLSFVGTVLGGIWADQSWGRFWGWDPKENGAVLIVIWNALILHARWAGLVKDRGVAVLALVGNVITTWSWFGTNQLGVGLHNYGFNNALAAGCAITWMVHAGLILVGLTPPRFWKSTPNRASVA